MLRIVAASLLGVAVFGKGKEEDPFEACEPEETGTEEGDMASVCGCMGDEMDCKMTGFCMWEYDEEAKKNLCGLNYMIFEAKGEEYTEKAGKIKESKKSLKRKLKKMMKKGAKLEAKLKALLTECKRRRVPLIDDNWIIDDPNARKPDIDDAWDLLDNDDHFEPEVWTPGWNVPLWSTVFNEGESYSEAQGKIKGMFNGLSKKKLKAELEKAEIDVKAIKKKYKKEMRKCGK